MTVVNLIVLIEYIVAQLKGFRSTTEVLSGWAADLLLDVMLLEICTKGVSGIDGRIGSKFSFSPTPLV